MSTYDLEDALRALKDRPSMERELAELRHVVIAQQKELAALRVENERLKAALREIASVLHGGDGDWSHEELRALKIARAAL